MRLLHRDVEHLPPAAVEQLAQHTLCAGAVDGTLTSRTPYCVDSDVTLCSVTDRGSSRRPPSSSWPSTPCVSTRDVTL
ncbi:unnamed protein product [Plutella xylostella]|uniref:(diamondback moth) hypothetical protein n=1 Tax=Plutella xylostella TaxID=51655 RepID=A0A8S4D4D4_PLUXY|nr:unnamed protein product [Plutella xylostella]